MDEWSRTKLDPYLARLINGEARGPETCELCHSNVAEWRCLGCVGSPRLCATCCRVAHRANPFHRVERWSGTHWNPAWLWHVGTIVCLGHGLSPCPIYQATLEKLEMRAIALNEVDNFADDPTYGAAPKDSFVGSGSVVLFVHSNGFHHLPVFPCGCSHALDDDLQFLDKGLYPTTWRNVSTVFTLDSLKHAHLMKVQEHMSTDNYCEVLRRLTNPAFPMLCPVSRSDLPKFTITNGASGSHEGDGSRVAAVEPPHPAHEERLRARQPGRAPRSWRPGLILRCLPAAGGEPPARLEEGRNAVRDNCDDSSK